MAIQIDTPDAAFSTQTVTLNKKTYRIKNRYNTRFGYWCVDILDAQNSPILLGEKLLPNKELLSRYRKSDLIGGYLFITSQDESDVSRDNYGLDKTHTLTFATFEEVEALTNG